MKRSRPAKPGSADTILSIASADWLSVYFQGMNASTSARTGHPTPSSMPRVWQDLFEQRRRWSFPDSTLSINSQFSTFNSQSHFLSLTLFSSHERCGSLFYSTTESPYLHDKNLVVPRYTLVRYSRI